MISFLSRVPWGKFLLLWFLALLMGASLLWLHYGFTAGILVPFLWLAAFSGPGLLWATTRPRWEKAHCSWCAARVRAKAARYDEASGGWVMIYECDKCGHRTEKAKRSQGAVHG